MWAAGDSSTVPSSASPRLLQCPCCYSCPEHHAYRDYRRKPVGCLPLVGLFTFCRKPVVSFRSATSGRAVPSPFNVGWVDSAEHISRNTSYWVWIHIWFYFKFILWAIQEHIFIFDFTSNSNFVSNSRTHFWEHFLLSVDSYLILIQIHFLCFFWFCEQFSFLCFFEFSEQFLPFQLFFVAFVFFILDVA